MHSEHSPPPAEASTIPVLVAADLQDHLMVATNDLERLQRLLDDACNSLMHSFAGARERIAPLLDDGAVAPGDAALLDAMDSLGRAVTALQFQDMASQLVAHTTRRLRSCADRLARDAFAADEDGEAVVEEAPLRPNPVTQDEMDAGSIELF
jgi:hypothetical protein